MSTKDATIKRRNSSDWDIINPITVGQNIYGSGANDTTPLLNSSDQIDSAFLGNVPTELFWATYGTTTGEQIANAIANNKYVCCKYNGSIYGNVMLHSGEARYYLTGLYGSYTRRAVRCSQTGATWSTSDTTFMDYFNVDNVSISTHQKINTINANYNASTNKLATASDLPQVKRYI